MNIEHIISLLSNCMPHRQVQNIMRWYLLFSIYRLIGTGPLVGLKFIDFSKVVFF